MDRHEIVALFNELWNQDFSGIHGSLVDIVHQDDGAVLYIVQHILHRLFRILCFPVQGIDGPQDHRPVNRGSDGIIDCPVWRSDNRGGMSHQIGDLLIRLCKLACNIFRRKCGKIRVVIGMISDLTAKCFHSG